MNDTSNGLSKKDIRAAEKEIAQAHEEFRDALLRRAHYKTSDKELSEDLVQTTFLKTLLYLQRGGKIQLMRSFLNHVLGDLIIDEYRYRKNKVISLDTLIESGYEPSISEIERAIDILDGETLIELIPYLPDKYEVVVRLRYLQGLSLKEISLITNQTQNTVAVQVHRGIAKLRKLYEEKVTE
jgi:RNA polymerase sigma-70 factor, ECF subfamily